MNGDRNYFNLIRRVMFMSNQPVYMRTKSGTKVYLTDNKVSIVEQKRALSTFIKIYNNSFGVEEQKKMGNIIYHYNKAGKNWSRMGTLPRGIKDKDVLAAHEEYDDKNNKKLVNGLNPGKKKIAMVGFSKKSYNNEYAVIHETLHSRDALNNKRVSSKKADTLKDEQQTDFETVGRLSKKGLKQHLVTPHGYYFYNKKISNKGNLKSKKELAASAIIQDRKLLTGSLNTNITGKVASSKSKSLFKKSFFNQKSFGVK
jgi:hypothetical protein